jgi:DNA-binding beta-propeller fold protein YncE
MLAALALAVALLTAPGLAQLPGPSGCLSSHRIPPGCTLVPSLRGGLTLAATPQTVFVSGRTAITALRRDPATGALAYAGSAPHGVAGGGVGLTVSPDGAYLYATSEIGTTWYPASGPLVAIGQVSAFGSSIVIGPDGLHAYLADVAGVRVLARDPMTGSLTAQSCVGCDGHGGPELADLFGLAIAPDGHSLYAASSDALLTFAVGADGNLAEQGCRGSVGACRRTANFDGLRDVDVSPDGRTVAIASEGHAVTFVRGPDGALSPARCDYATDTPTHGTRGGCRPATFDGVEANAFAADGRLLVGGERNVATVSSDRLTPLACLNDADDGLDHRCRRARGIEFATDVAVVGASGYVATRDGRVAVLKLR